MKNKELLLWVIVIFNIRIISAQPQKQIGQSIADSTIVQLVEEHFEKWALERTRQSFDSTISHSFTGFELYGVVSSDTLIEAYGWVYFQVYYLTNNQVFLGFGGSNPTVGLLKRTKDSLFVTGHWTPGAGAYFEPSIVQRFPTKYKNKAFENPGELAWLRTNSKVIAYWGNLLDENRFISKPKPIGTNDPHNHKEYIYSYLNFKEYYGAITIVLAKPEELKKEIPPWSSTTLDGRYVVWHRDGLFLWDVWTDSIFKIVNSMSNEILSTWGEKWKDNRTLVFDQVNGYMHGEPWGVHIEFDIPTRKVIWVVPFGPLGYPRKAEVLESIVPAKSVKLYGTVADGTNRSILTNTKVEIQGQNKIVVTDKDGRFEFRGLPTGQYILNISRQGYYPRTLKVIATGYETETVNVLLFDSSYGRVKGRVIDAEEGYGVPDVDVGADYFRPRARTDEKGRFILDGLKPGYYRLRIFPRKGHCQTNVDVKLEPGVTVHCDIKTEKFNN